MDGLAGVSFVDCDIEGVEPPLSWSPCEAYSCILSPDGRVIANSVEQNSVALLSEGNRYFMEMFVRASCIPRETLRQARQVGSWPAPSCVEVRGNSFACLPGHPRTSRFAAFGVELRKPEQLSGSGSTFSAFYRVARINLLPHYRLGNFNSEFERRQIPTLAIRVPLGDEITVEAQPLRVAVQGYPEPPAGTVRILPPAMYCG